VRVARGHKPGWLGYDRACTAALLDRFHLPARALGYSPVMDRSESCPRDHDFVAGGCTPRRRRLVSWQPAQVGVDGLSRLDADAAVDGLDAVGAGDDGTQLELGDLPQVVGHPGDPQQHVP
jgi:hypothetical protein